MRLDPILHPLVSVRGERREVFLERLLGERAERVVSRVIAQRIRSGRLGTLRDDERNDLHASALLRVLQRLREIGDPAAAPIENFDNYVATVTIHACDDLLRERMPRRTLAKNRVRYILRIDRHFAQWTVGDEIVCGLHAWAGRETFAANVPVERIRHRSGDLDVRRTLNAIFAAAAQPVELDALVTAAAELWQMVDRPAAQLEPDALEQASTISRELENRQYLGRLWDEIRALNRPQRVALLLNLRDENGPATDLFPMLGVATIEEIAEAVEVPIAEFRALWRTLPLDDLRLASLLGITRQQVINLRKSARERLRRRMRN